MTYLQIINKVLNRLRLSEVSSLTQDDYTKALGAMVNDIKREVEDAWQWTTLRSVITCPTVASTQEYTLTGTGERGKILLDENNAPRIWNNTTDTPVSIISHEMLHRLSNSSSTQTGDVSHVCFIGQDATTHDQKVKFWPIPGSVQSIQFHYYVPQAELAATSTVLEVPWYPVYLGALALAVDERGEDGGFPESKAERRYRSALAEAVIFDSLKVQHELELRVG